MINVFLNLIYKILESDYMYYVNFKSTRNTRLIIKLSGLRININTQIILYKNT